MKRKVFLVGLLVTAIAFAAAVSSTYAATEDEIEVAITNGVAWLVSRQYGNGSWGDWEQAAHTCFALVKLEERAYELGYQSPFDPAYPYAQNVSVGWQYIFGTHTQMWSPLGVQWHAGNPDDPDTNANGYGVYFDTWGSHRTYTTGICLMALAASGTPDRPNDGGLDFNGNGSADTFKEIAQEAVDWLAFAQGDAGGMEGGWGYEENDNGGWWADNSNSGYAVLGLAYGEDFGSTIPDWVRTELNVWIGYIQCSAPGSDFGGSGYSSGCDWVNQLKAGNLIFEMTFYGDDPSMQRFQDALDYIVRHWQDQSTDPGWGYNVNPANYQAMYTLMKGFEYSGIELIDLDSDGTPEHDWFDEFSTVLVGQQNGDGSWPGWCNWGDDILCTTWALLTLEKVSPPPPVIEVYVDIKPGSCPNPFNLKDKGVLPVAVLGTNDFDVTTIDPATILLTREGYDVGVSPLRWAYEDVATPYTGEPGGCHALKGDGHLDLTLKFESQMVKTTLGLAAEAGNTIPLLITGNLKEEAGGTAIEGSDYVRVLATGK